MPVPSQSPELIGRFRRAFRVRGQLPLAVDELVVGVMSLGEADYAGYRGRHEPRFAAGVNVGAVAAQFSIAQIGLFRADQIAVNEPRRCVIDSVSVASSAASRWQAGFTLLAGPNATDVFSYDAGEDPPPATTARRSGAGTRVLTSGASQITGQRCADGQSSATVSDTRDFPGGLLIHPQVLFTVELATVNLGLSVTFIGRIVTLDEVALGQ